MPDMPVEPALSLCIPTFNRAGFLAEALQAILSQMDGAQRDRVEILVSDNASTDATQETVERFQRAWPGTLLRFTRLAENRGVDANIYSVFQGARGTFVYWLSDDDLLLPGAVAKLLELIDTRPDMDAFCLNVCSFITDAQDASAPWIAAHEDAVLTDRNQALSVFNCTFLSMIAFRRVLVTRDYWEHDHTNLLQSYVFVDVLARSRGMVVVAHPYLAQRRENSGGYGFFRVMVTNFAALFAYARRLGYAEATTDHLLSIHLRGAIFPFISGGKLSGRWRIDAWEAFRRMLPVYGKDLFFWAAVVPLLLTPSLPLRKVRDCYKWVRGRRQAVQAVGGS